MAMAKAISAINALAGRISVEKAGVMGLDVGTAKCAS
jgi:hypothetical protein